MSDLNKTNVFGGGLHNSTNCGPPTVQSFNPLFIYSEPSLVASGVELAAETLSMEKGLVEVKVDFSVNGF